MTDAMKGLQLSIETVFDAADGGKLFQVRCIADHSAFTICPPRKDRLEAVSLRRAFEDALRSVIAAEVEASRLPQAGAATSDAVFLIYFDDRDRSPEIIVGEAGARHRFKVISGAWNAHLFGKIESNCRDDRYFTNNIVPASPAPSDAAGVSMEGQPMGDPHPCDMTTADLDRYLASDAAVQPVEAYQAGTVAEWRETMMANLMGLADEYAHLATEAADDEEDLTEFERMAQESRDELEDALRAALAAAPLDRP